MKTFTNCAEKKAKQFFNLLQGYTKGIRMTAILILLLMGVSNAWAEPWLCRSTAGGKIATKTVGDKLNNGNEWNYTYTTNGGWSTATDIQVYVGTSTTSYTTVNAVYISNDGNTNKNVAANIGSVSFDKSGKWYAVGKYKADGKTAYTTKNSEWTNNTTFSMGSNDEPYWEVTPPAVSNFSVSVSGYLSGTGTSNDPYIIQPGNSLQLTLSGNKAKTDVNSTIQYNTAGTWNTTNSRTISNITSITKTSVTVKMRCYNSTAKLSGTESSKTIYYRAQSFAVTISADANGTVSPSGSQQVGATDFNITATPSTGYAFKQWKVTGGAKVANATSATTTITATAAGSVTAHFYEIIRDITVAANNANYGTVSPTSVKAGVVTQSDKINATPKAGYEFVNWTAASGITLAYTTSTPTHVTKATASGKITANFQEIKHAITIQSNDNSFGTVNKSSASVGQHTAVSITATSNIGYVFKNWTATDGITITNANVATTTIKATQAGTVTANFEKAKTTTVYLKPNAAWKQVSARFAVYYWADGNKNAWSDMANIDCNNEYYAAEVPSECSGFQFVRMNGSTSANNWDNDWNQTIDLKLPTNGKTMFDMNKGKVYLKPNSEWKSDGARFAAYFFSKNGETTTLEQWMSMFDAEDGTYYCEIPAGQPQSVIFCRMDPKNQTNGWGNNSVWNKTVDLQLVDADIFTIEDAHFGTGNTGIATGSWNIIWSAPTYDVTLYSSEFGNYGFTLNGQTYTSPASGSIVYQVPIGATVQLFANPHNEAYDDNLMMNQGGTQTEVSANNTSLTIDCNTILDDNYKTTGAHVVYLAVPNNGGEWVNNAATEHYAYAFHSRTGSGQGAAIEMTELATVYVEQVPHICYRCEIPEGYNTIRFEKRTSGGVTNIKTVDLNYQIPFNSVNCYRLNGKSSSLFTGVWETLPAIANDYRILYVEQTVEYGEIRFDKSHPSDIVKLTNTGEEAIVSLHLYNKRAEGVNGTNNAAVILQRCTGYDAGVAQWEEVEYHMVYNYLFSDASAALLPGRRNTVELQAHDGLEVIKAVADSEEHDYGSGVWNFTIKKTDGSATLLLDKNHLEPYEGNYYIRTSNAEGGWINYSIPANYMTFSSYAKKHSDFSHYFCRWVNVSNDSRNVKFVVANDYGANISKELEGDDIIGQGTSDLPANANVRWQWNMVTNEVKRAYIDGATEDNITITKNTANPGKLDDAGNWIYRTDLANIAPGDKITAITANYNKKSQTLLENTYQTDGMPMLTGEGTGYSVRVRYDFKINETTVYLIPNGTTEATTNIDVLIERTNQGYAQQVSKAIKAADTENGYTVYAVMSFTKSHIEGSGTQSEKLYYWVSFPFDVRISDVFGFGEYGVHWIMEYYDGAERARNGAWVDSPTYWRYITDTTSVDIPDNNKNLNCGILKANQGYVLALALNIANMGIFTNTDKVSLYFPSMSPITTQIDGAIIETTVELAPYTCTIERDNRKIHDSNWHIIGVPSFSDKQQTLTQDNLLYFYTRDQEDDKYIATSTQGSSITFKSLHSYMVQYAGIINWATAWTLSQPQGLAAKRNAGTEKTHSLRLELSRNGTYNDQTLVTLQEEGATEAFDMNLDLSKMMNAGNNIYTLAGGQLIQVAGNALPIANTVIPVGVQIATAGEYTFAMPDGTDGITVELIDYETNTTTNLMLDEYTVDLAAGTCESRFALHVKPNKVATDMENITTPSDSELRKFIIDGKLYMQKDGMLYDAQGHIVR